MLNPRLTFTFVRHGVTDYNQARVIMGQLDIPLNRTGRDQARRAAAALVGSGIRRIFASPLLRARETAEIIAVALELEITYLDGLKERRWGVLEGRPLAERPDFTPEGAESVAEFDARVLAALAEIPPGEGLCLVAHSGTCRALRRTLIKGSDGEGMVPNAVPLSFAPRQSDDWTETALIKKRIRQKAGLGGNP